MAVTQDRAAPEYTMSCHGMTNQYFAKQAVLIHCWSEHHSFQLLQRHFHKKPGLSRCPADSAALTSDPLTSVTRRCWMSHSSDSWPEVKPSCVVNSYLTTTPSGDPAVNSRALGYSMGTREWNLCLRSLCGDMSLCLTSWMFDILFHSVPRSQWNTVCSVSEKWRFRWLSLLRKDWNFQDKTR